MRTVLTALRIMRPNPMLLAGDVGSAKSDLGIFSNDATPKRKTLQTKL